MPEPDQLAFNLAHRPALDREDFFAARSNAAALELIDQWPNWPAFAILVVGPEGSGKTHLTYVWQAQSQAARISARALTDARVASLAWTDGLIVEDIDQGISEDQALFHVLNSARELGRFVLITSRKAPGEIAIDLPDLRSRLRALPVALIEPPDDALAKAVLVKLFADRQLTVDPQVVEYLALHGDRSMAALTRLVALVDELSLTLQRRVTKPIAAAALKRLAGEDAQSDHGDAR